MGTTVKMDLFHDYVEMAREKLKLAGYAEVQAESDDDALRRYFNVARRRVPVASRKTHKSSSLICPSELQQGLDALIATSETGGDLRPYQSTLLTNSTFSDLLLNDWGFQHFHLGTGLHPTNPGFKARTGPLLFAILTPTDLYCITVGDHANFAEQELLEIVHREWPDLLPSIPRPTGNEKLALVPSNNDIKKFRHNQINAVTAREDGAINVGAGGGLTLKKGQSMAVTMAFTRMVAEVRNWEKLIREVIDENPGGYPPDLKLKLDASDGWLRAVDPNGNSLFKLSDLVLIDL